MNKVILFVFLYSSISLAEPITPPHVFVPSSPAKASEVNLNFSTLYNEANRKEARLESVEANPNTLRNYSLVTTVENGNLSIEMKARNGFDLSSRNKASIGFRSTNIASGLFDVLQVQSRQQITIPKGATLGHKNNKVLPIYVYAINSAGQVQLAVSQALYSEDELFDTLALNGNSDYGQPLYSKQSLSQVPVRLFGRVTSFQSNAGVWTFTPDEVTLAAHLKKNIGSSGWIDAQLTNSWKEYSPSYSKPKFFRSSDGIVRLQGVLKDGVCDSAFFTLPEGFRPARRKIFMAFSGSNYSITRIDVLADGRVKTITGCNNSWVNLENINFAANE